MTTRLYLRPRATVAGDEFYPALLGVFARDDGLKVLDRLAPDFKEQFVGRGEPRDGVADERGRDQAVYAEGGLAESATAGEDVKPASLPRNPHLPGVRRRQLKRYPRRRIRPGF